MSETQRKCGAVMLSDRPEQIAATVRKIIDEKPTRYILFAEMSDNVITLAGLVRSTDDAAELACIVADLLTQVAEDHEKAVQAGTPPPTTGRVSIGGKQVATIAAHWAIMENMLRKDPSFPDGATKNMRRMFYTGARTVLSMVISEIQDDAKDPPAVSAAIRAMDDELDHFCKELLREAMDAKIIPPASPTH